MMSRYLNGCCMAGPQCRGGVMLGLRGKKTRKGRACGEREEGGLDSPERTRRFTEEIQGMGSGEWGMKWPMTLPAGSIFSNCWVRAMRDEVCGEFERLGFSFSERKKVCVT